MSSSLETRVYCGSDVIHREQMEQSGVDEYPDGLFVDLDDCQRCGVNCPKNPNGYTTDYTDQGLKQRIENPWW